MEERLNKNLAMSKFKAFAVDNSNVAKMFFFFFFSRLENIERKGKFFWLPSSSFPTQASEIITTSLHRRLKFLDPDTKWLLSVVSLLLFLSTNGAQAPSNLLVMNWQIKMKFLMNIFVKNYHGVFQVNNQPIPKILINPLPHDKFYTLPNWKSLQTTISNLTKMAESYPNG